MTHPLLRAAAALPIGDPERRAILASFDVIRRVTKVIEAEVYNTGVFLAKTNRSKPTFWTLMEGLTTLCSDLGSLRYDPIAVQRFETVKAHYKKCYDAAFRCDLNVKKVDKTWDSYILAHAKGFHADFYIEEIQKLWAAANKQYRLLEKSHAEAKKLVPMVLEAFRDMPEENQLRRANLIEEIVQLAKLPLALQPLPDLPEIPLEEPFEGPRR